MELPLPQDFKEFLRLLNSEQIEYLIVGGYAVAYHGYPRPTGDLDIWVEVSRDTAARLVVALEKFGFGRAGATEELFLEPGRVIRLGEPPVRIELLTSITGVAFVTCRQRSIMADFDGVPAYVISREDLITNKVAAGRDRDRDDVRHLRQSR
jgi:predicted nucleotidyltransferase